MTKIQLRVINSLNDSGALVVSSHGQNSLYWLIPRVGKRIGVHWRTLESLERDGLIQWSQDTDQYLLTDKGKAQ